MRVLNWFGRFVIQSASEDFRAMLLVYAGEPKQAESHIHSVIENRTEAVLKNELNLSRGDAVERSRQSGKGS